MKNVISGVLAISVYVMSSAVSWADEMSPVQIKWNNPQDYRDIRAAQESQSRYQQRLFKSLESYFQKHMVKLLDSGQSLEVIVHDVDLAGDVTPMMSMAHGDIRVVRTLYPPSMDIEFKLHDQQGKLLAQKRETIRDLGFMHTFVSRHRDDALAYDKALIQDWITVTVQPALIASR